MKLVFVKIGKLAHRPVGDLVEEYEARLAHFARVDVIYLKQSGEKIDTATADRLDGLVKNSDFTVALDATGKSVSSEELAARLDRWINIEGQRTVTFFVGGAFGFPASFAEKADFCWSLSKATFPSDLAWLLAFEQVYRAYTINKGIKYHHA